HDLWFGQLSIMLLAILTLSWLALAAGHDVRGGAYLGVAVALKLTAWPIGLYLLARGRWRAVLGAAAVVLALNAGATLGLGWNTVARYFTATGPAVAEQCSKHDENYSLWTIGPRLFSPEVAQIANNFLAEPLWDVPELARSLRLVLPLLALGATLFLALRCR